MREPARTSFGSTLGVIAVAFGLGVLGAYALDLHAHTCDACGHRWRHLGALNHGDPSAHACAQCGQLQWWKDHQLLGAPRAPAAPAIESQEIAHVA